MWVAKFEVWEPGPLWIRVQYLDLAGRAPVDTFAQAIARLALHEIDHLEGRLYTAHMPPSERVIDLDDYRQGTQPGALPTRLIRSRQQVSRISA